MCKTRVPAGEGRDAYDRARSWVRSWGPFDATGWTMVDDANAGRGKHPRPGDGVVVTALMGAAGLGCWAALPLSVVYAGEEKTCDGGAAYRVGVGCLHGHWLRGEERFSVERVGRDGAVTIEVASLSGPAPGLVPHLLYPVNRLLQLRFGRDLERGVKRSLLGG